MSSVIEASFRRLWANVVYVLDDQGHELAIDGPREALRYLREDMADHSGHAYCSAILVCMAATANSRHLERSRESFVAAYLEHREQSAD
ncbi:DUF982 domain-containing protein [Rhizobium sp. NFR07]|uniref:DUF982 domain-containing protein n=1 Tax=Rhizobium sp. NFR07 TaxID=1566262 RepID=UPI0015A65A8B|nr:DUF982 domain-containing protein [Rhizobium sp. NFR07]